MNEQNQRTDNRYSADLGVKEGDVAGPGGADLPGGEVTPPQDAAVQLDESNAARTQSESVEELQQAGRIEQQTIHQKPMAGEPDGGLPTETPVESESSGEPQKVGHKVENSYENSRDDAKKNTEAGADVNADVKTDVNAENNSAEDELAQTKNQLLQLAADFENYKRQAARRETEARERAVRGVLEDLLPVLDNFERAVAAAQNSSDVQSLKVGIEFILRQFEEAMKNNGVEPIETKGQSFDPARHEALEQVESDQETGTIVNEVQRGYSYKGNVLRPSRVRVAK